MYMLRSIWEIFWHLLGLNVKKLWARQIGIKHFSKKTIELIPSPERHLILRIVKAHKSVKKVLLPTGSLIWCKLDLSMQKFNTLLWIWPKSKQRTLKTIPYSWSLSNWHKLFFQKNIELIPSPEHHLILHIVKGHKSVKKVLLPTLLLSLRPCYAPSKKPPRPRRPQTLKSLKS